jgi:hypothetical protein
MLHNLFSLINERETLYKIYNKGKILRYYRFCSNLKIRTAKES